MIELSHEIKIAAGNVAWKVWKALPEPKPKYTSWYYERRYQSLSEALEGVIVKEGVTINNQQSTGRGKS